MNAFLESIAVWMLLHPMGVYCAAGGTLLAFNTFFLFSATYNPFPEIDMSIPDLIRVFEEGRLGEYSPEQLIELQKMADGCVAVFDESKLPIEQQMRQKLLDISTRISEMTTISYGLDGMTRLKPQHA